jgi:hypothetical protein
LEPEVYRVRTAAAGYAAVSRQNDMSKNGKVDNKSVLIAIPDEPEIWNRDKPKLVRFLEDQGFTTISIALETDIRSAIEKHIPSAILILSDWALEIGMMASVKGKIPTVCLISDDTYRNTEKNNWFEELFHPPRHEYTHLPGDMDQIANLLNSVIDNP